MSAGGELRQDCHTGQMSHAAASLLVFTSSGMILEPADVIATGGPARVGPMAAGQLVEVEGIGSSGNQVVIGHRP